MKKTVLITGSSRGIGRATAMLFAREGYRTVIHYQQAEKEALSLLAQLRGEGHTAIALQADIGDRKQVDRLFEKVTQQLGAVDVLVNNAGIAQQKLFIDLTDEDWDNMLRVHVNGMFYCSQCAAPPMIHKGAGKIINISSIWGITGGSCEVHYSTAKAAVIGFTKALAKELGSSGIQVNCVAPGIIETDMNASLTDQTACELKENTPLQRFGSAQDVANSILFLASDKADFITGQVLSPNGGFVI